jgi:N-acetylmuramoyl-L-alanine amidase
LSKQIATIPLGNISKLQIYINSEKKTLSAIRKETGADYVLNGGLFNPDWTACPLLKADGVMRSKTTWRAYGFGWNRPEDISLRLDYENASNFISCVCLLRGGKREKLSVTSALDGARQRSAIGLMGDKLVLYCTDEGTTPGALQRELEKLGCTDAVMLDGGGSSQCDFGGKQIKAARVVHNLLLVYTKKTGEAPEKGDKPVGRQYKVTPSVGVNIRSGPGTGYSKVGAYACGTVVAVTAAQGGWGQTAKGWVALEYLAAVEGAQRTTDTGMEIRPAYIDAGRKNRPGGINPCRYITIHETGNKACGADAEAHGTYLNSSAGEADLVSWHYTVDDHAIVQHLPDGETAYHAGDGKAGTGNAQSIGIEICVNADGDFAKAKANAAALVRLLMEEHGIPIANVVQHNRWNGKDCPYAIRHTSGAWEAFLALCGGESAAETDRKTVQERFGLADETMDYLEAYKYGADLLKKLAGGK